MTNNFFFILFLMISRIVWANDHTNETEASKSALRTETHYGNAFFDKEKKNAAYTEKHVAIFSSGKLLSSTNDYFDVSGKKIAELNSDYSRSILMPTYTFKDLRTGLEEGLRWVKGKYFIFRKESKGKEEVSLLENSENVFSGQGWHYYLIENLDRIQKSPLQMKLLFPSKLDYYSFRIRALESKDMNVLNLRLEFDSWFVRLFAPHLDIRYNKTSKKIIRYYGPSNILDEKGEVQNVYIFYH